MIYRYKIDKVFSAIRLATIFPARGFLKTRVHKNLLTTLPSDLSLEFIPGSRLRMTSAILMKAVVDHITALTLRSLGWQTSGLTLWPLPSDSTFCYSHDMTPYRKMYRGLSPHKIMLMPGTHKARQSDSLKRLSTLLQLALKFRLSQIWSVLSFKVFRRVLWSRNSNCQLQVL